MYACYEYDVIYMPTHGHGVGTNYHSYVYCPNNDCLMTYCLFRGIACIDMKSSVNCLPAFPVFAVCQASKSILVLDVYLSIIFLF